MYFRDFRFTADTDNFTVTGYGLIRVDLSTEQNKSGVSLSFGCHLDKQMFLTFLDVYFVK